MNVPSVNGPGTLPVRPAAASQSDSAKRVMVILFLCLVSMIVLPAGRAGAVTLEECIREALERNPDTQAAAMRVEAAQALILEAGSAYFPQLSVVGTYAATDNPTQAFMMQLNQRTLDIRSPEFDPNDPGNTDNIRLSAALKYRVYDFGQRRMQTESAELGAEAADFQLQSIRNELVYQVTRGYFGVLQALDFVTVQSETISSLEESLQMAQARFTAGTTVKTDVLNLEVQLAQARDNLIRARNSADLATAVLNAIIGYDFVSPQNLPTPATEALNPPPAVFDLDAVENRPEFKATSKMAQAKEKEFLKHKRLLFPVVNAYGSYDLDSGNLDSFEGSYLVGITAEWDLFTGYRNSGAIRNAKAQWNAARQQELKVRNDLKLDLKQAQLQVVESWQRMDVVRKSVASAEESLRITRVRYREGVAGLTDLLTAQVGLTATRTRNVAAYYDYTVAMSNLQRARGELHTLYSLSD
jgi:outer membrane protein TolC